MGFRTNIVAGAFTILLGITEPACTVYQSPKPFRGNLEYVINENHQLIDIDNDGRKETIYLEKNLFGTFVYVEGKLHNGHEIKKHLLWRYTKNPIRVTVEDVDGDGDYDLIAYFPEKQQQKLRVLGR